MTDPTGGQHTEAIRQAVDRLTQPLRVSTPVRERQLREMRRARGEGQMDVIDLFVVNLHLMLGHDQAAAFIGAPAYDRAECRLCHPELVGKLTQHEAMQAIEGIRVCSPRLASPRYTGLPLHP